MQKRDLTKSKNSWKSLKRVENGLLKKIYHFMIVGKLFIWVIWKLLLQACYRRIKSASYSVSCFLHSSINGDMFHPHSNVWSIFLVIRLDTVVSQAQCWWMFLLTSTMTRSTGMSFICNGHTSYFLEIM